jgi:hypothetical protein
MQPPTMAPALAAETECSLDVGEGRVFVLFVPLAVGLDSDGANWSVVPKAEEGCDEVEPETGIGDVVDGRDSKTK